MSPVELQYKGDVWLYSTLPLSSQTLLTFCRSYSPLAAVNLLELMQHTYPAEEEKTTCFFVFITMMLPFECGHFF